MSGLIALLRLLLVAVLGFIAFRALRRWLQKDAAGKIPDENKAGQDKLEQCPVCRDYLPASAGNCGKLHCPRGGPTMAGLAFLFVLLAPVGAQADSGGRYLAEIRGSNVVVTLRVNDMAIGRWQLTDEAGAGASLNHWLRVGSNRIELKAEPLQSGRSALLAARVYFMGVATGQQTNLLQLSDIDKARSGSMINFVLPSAPELALWQSKATAQLSEKDALQLLGQLRIDLATAFSSGADWQQLPSLALERADLARAFGITATSQPLAQKGQNPQDEVEISRLPQWAELVVEPVAAGGLSRMARRDGRPVVAARHDGRVYAITALIVGQIDGRWQILRRSY